MKHAAGGNEQGEELHCLAMEFFLHEKVYTNCCHLYDLD